MRAKVEFSSKPLAREVKTVGDVAHVYIRENIKKETREFEGNSGTVYTAIEYTVDMKATPNLEITDELAQKIIESVTAYEAKKVREIRNQLLAESDCYVLPDRPENKEIINAWKAYRQALRDIPEQQGFPFEVIFPVKP